MNNQLKRQQAMVEFQQSSMEHHKLSPDAAEGTNEVKGYSRVRCNIAIRLLDLLYSTTHDPFHYLDSYIVAFV